MRRAISAAEAAVLIPDGASVMFGGFMGVGNLPPTSVRPVSLVVTDLAALHPTPDGLLLQERAPGVSVAEIIAATAAPLIVADDVPEMGIVAAEPAAVG